MNPIYAQHEKAFANVSAYVILHGGELVGRVSIKYGARVTAFVHFHGTVMRKGVAGGGGYDRTTAAVLAAAKSIDANCPHSKKPMGDAAAFVTIAAKAQDGLDWVTVFEKAGYTILRAI